MKTALLTFAAVAAFATTGAYATDALTEQSLRATDALQRELISARDADRMRDLAHRNLRINAPTNVVLSKDQLVEMMANGQIAAENFIRVPESVTITANVGVVMGRETFTPTPDSASGRMFGARPIDRRYTNVYLFEGGKWRFLARHANVVPPAAR